MTRKVLSLIAAAVLGVSCAAAGSPVTHAATSLALHLDAKNCKVHGYKHAKCKLVLASGHKVTIHVPGGHGVSIVISPQADDVEVLVVAIANPCPRDAKAVGVRIIVINATTGQIEQKLQPPFQVNARKVDAFNPQTGSCTAVQSISQPGAYALTK